MSKSLQQHGMAEIYKQLRFSMKKHALETVEVEVTRHCGKFKINFTGSPEEVVKANQILASWA
jgi:hypothetical protein